MDMICVYYIYIFYGHIYYMMYAYLHPCMSGEQGGTKSEHLGYFLQHAGQDPERRHRKLRL